MNRTVGHISAMASNQFFKDFAPQNRWYPARCFAPHFNFCSPSPPR